MATAEQIKALLRSHIDRDEHRFYSIALQVAAKEARIGHTKLAGEIKVLIDKAQAARPAEVASTVKATPLNRPPQELNGLLQLSHPTSRLSELILSAETNTRINRIIIEQRQKDKLGQYGLSPRRKILFTGPPGTGKTLTSSVLASELKLPLYTIVLDSLITRYMGETASKLRLVFDHIKQTRAIYLFDEFDAIGTQRGSQNDVGEIRRVLNSLLLLIEQDTSESIIIAATNHPELLDKALYRRFDDIIPFEKPDKSSIKKIIVNKLCQFDLKDVKWPAVINKAEGLSSAEIARACDDAAKEAVLHNESTLTDQLLVDALAYKHLHT
ncbi:AAA family ATPase [Pseudomonas sichuanensis]|uniref:AAA family ATPase n=1 Tax=Pseudomonas sichuanensis TaxID=2213015 RepID=UPI000DA6A901|nr:AAA family ATPase [Pseudomonas sichuanensis]